MTDLLTAAKAVIEMWDNSPPVEHCQRRAALRAAVERAEKQEAVGFDWWLSAHTKELMTWDVASFARLVWNAAQQAERERIKGIVQGLITQSDPWIHFSTLLEKIDASDYS